MGGSIIIIGLSGISNLATNTETLSNGVRTSVSQTWSTDAGGSLVLGGTVDLNNSSGAARTLTVNGAGNTTFNGTIQNSFSGNSSNLTYSGAGILTLAGANTYSGVTTLSSGTLNIHNASAIGTGTFTITGGTFSNSSGGAITLSTNNAQSWNGDFTFGKR